MGTTTPPHIRYFNSRPHKEVDDTSMHTSLIEYGEFQFTTSQGGRPYALCFTFWKHCSFQFTTSQGGRRYFGDCLCNTDTFQFTTSQGGRLFFLCQPYSLLSFQFTTSQGGRQPCAFRVSSGGLFQFTTSQGGRRLQMFHSHILYHFNSRPHKEVDSHF